MKPQTQDEPEDQDSDQTTAMRLTALRPLPVALSIGHYFAFVQEPEVRRVRIDAPGVTVGRQPPCEVVIPAVEVSRRHARIDIASQRATLTDLGSTNGTFLDGTRIAGPTPLVNGSLVSFGSVTARYERRDQREVAEEAELAGELRRAADYVRAILPQPLTDGPVQTDWWFVPSSQLGGDAFGYQYLDDDTFGGFVLDVSGHGIGSAMHAANVANAIRRRSLPGVDFRDPGQVAAGVNAVFPMEEHNGLMLTLWYFSYHLPTRALRFCAAGHHPSFLVSQPGAEPVPLWLKAPAIGMLPFGAWSVGRADIPPGARLYVFSDGAFEIVASNGQQWVIEDLRRIMQAPPQPELSESQRLYQAVRAAARPGQLDDDFSALVVHFS
ncbi:MAG: SpoIIE family protein phosphatase [Proteobacteria bacterium]|nr:SpoIIE family protein phosphatase [Pseudomonadota bacterium]